MTGAPSHPHTLAQPADGVVHQRVFRLSAPWGQSNIAVTYPWRRDRAHRGEAGPYPLVIALHGLSETRDPTRAHLAFVQRYGLREAFRALRARQLSRSDYQGFVEGAYLQRVNRSLAARPFQGAMIVAPACPNLAGQPIGSPEVRAFGNWLVHTLLPEVRERFPQAARDAETTGIDGISMGGRLALEIGFRHGDTFGAVGGIQPALHGPDIATLAGLLARPETPIPSIRLMSSEEDPFLQPTRALSRLLREHRISHRFQVTPGTHSYRYNRGPGVLELLLFHERRIASPESESASTDTRAL